MASTYRMTIGTLLDAARTMVAAVASLLLARLLKLPEFLLGADFGHRNYSVHYRPKNLSVAALCRDCFRCSDGRHDCEIFSRQCDGVRYRDFLLRCPMRAAAASRRLPFCGDYAEHHFIDRAPVSGLDRGLASVR